MTSKYNTLFKSETLTLSESTIGKGFWLWDETRGMNLAMRAKSEREAFTEAIYYYQKRLKQVEGEYKDLSTKVNMFVSQFVEEED